MASLKAARDSHFVSRLKACELEEYQRQHDHHQPIVRANKRLNFGDLDDHDFDDAEVSPDCPRTADHADRAGRPSSSAPFSDGGIRKRIDFGSSSSDNEGEVEAAAPKADPIWHHRDHDHRRDRLDLDLSFGIEEIVAAGHPPQPPPLPETPARTLGASGDHHQNPPTATEGGGGTPKAPPQRVNLLERDLLPGTSAAETPDCWSVVQRQVRRSRTKRIRRHTAEDRSILVNDRFFVDHPRVAPSCARKLLHGPHDPPPSSELFPASAAPSGKEGSSPTKKAALRIGRPWDSPSGYATPRNQHSPPTYEVSALRLHDASPRRRYHSAASLLQSSPNLVRFHPRCDASRRISAPPKLDEDGLPALSSGDPGARNLYFNSRDRKRKLSTNINPFTPTPTVESIKRRRLEENKGSLPVYTTSSASVNASPVEDVSGPSLNMDSKAANKSERDKSVDAKSPANFSLVPYRTVEFQQPKELPPRRFHVTDLNISRYEEEFLEIDEIASGEYGKVKVARHRLDGMIYAIKITKHRIIVNTFQEARSMNEVFAHAALIKHKHVVRYYNSWIEEGRIFIQNEYCEGGSLSARISELRVTRCRFAESELRRLLLHVARGLQYIHAKGLVHLDIKPENIFQSYDQTNSNRTSPSTDANDDEFNAFDEDEDCCSSDALGGATPSACPSGSSISSPVFMVPVVRESSSGLQKLDENGEAAVRTSENVTVSTADPQASTSSQGAVGGNGSRGRNFSGHDSTDSGNVSGCDSRKKKTEAAAEENIPQNEFKIIYKIGDLGHVIPTYGDYYLEEGDCRYMANELLDPHVNRDLMTKADIFSLGLTLYEAASLQPLPKNSEDSPEYVQIKQGNIPYLPAYSKDFNLLIRSMINSDPRVRPNAQRLVSLMTSKMKSGQSRQSRTQLQKELKETKERLKLLEQELLKERSMRSVGNSSSESLQFPTPPKDQSSSMISSPNESGLASLTSSTPTSMSQNNLSPRILRNRSCSKSINMTTPGNSSKGTTLRKRALARSATKKFAGSRLKGKSDGLEKKGTGIVSLNKKKCARSVFP